MGRLIDADVLLKDIRDNSQSYFADDFAKEWVDRQPTVHPEQPKTGKWIKNGNKYICPFCGTGFTTASEEVRSAHKFCFYCGAKMEESNGATD